MYTLFVKCCHLYIWNHIRKNLTVSIFLVHQERDLPSDCLWSTMSTTTPAGGGEVAHHPSLSQNPDTWTCRAGDQEGRVKVDCFKRFIFLRQCFFIFISKLHVFVFQVVHMQCNIEPVDEGAKHHVSPASTCCVSVSSVQEVFFNKRICWCCLFSWLYCWSWRIN